MFNLMVKPTWSVLLRGIIAIIFGLFALTYPGATLSVIVVLFGIYVFANGLLAVIFALYAKAYGDTSWWVYCLEGLASLIIGIIIFSWPMMTSIVLLYVIALWAIVTGIIQIITYIKLHRMFQQENLLLISGLLSLIIGIVIFRFPVHGVTTITWLVGLYALIFGVLKLISVFRNSKASQ